MVSRALVGRDAELDRIRSFLDDVPGGARVLLLSGPAGIGKTSVLVSAIEEATARGFRVVSTRPVEVETHLPFAALIDLLDGLADDHLSELAVPQRSAVEAALLRGSVARPPDPIGVSLGVLTILRRAAAEQPLLLAIDDVPWLDDSSARVLEFVVRRLAAEPVALLAARRTSGESSEDLPGLVRSAGAERRATLDIGPLELNETDRLLRGHLQLELDRSTLQRLHETSGGNAFFALELGRALQRQPSDADRLPIPASLAELVGARIDALSPDASRIVLFAACLNHPTRTLLTAALGDGAVTTGLLAAAEAGIIELTGETVRFTHPLLAAHRYGRASDDERREAHRKLAEVVSELEERAKHLALATSAPDPEVAAALEAAAEVARSRGAADAAADLTERAAALTPTDDPESARRRMFVAATYHAIAGDLLRARRLLRQLLESAEPGPHRRLVLTELAHLLLILNERPEAGRLLREALEMADDDPRTKIAIERELAGVAYLSW